MRGDWHQPCEFLITSCCEIGLLRSTIRRCTKLSLTLLLLLRCRLHTETAEHVTEARTQVPLCTLFVLLASGEAVAVQALDYGGEAVELRLQSGHRHHHRAVLSDSTSNSASGPSKPLRKNLVLYRTLRP